MGGPPLLWAGCIGFRGEFISVYDDKSSLRKNDFERISVNRGLKSCDFSVSIKICNFKQYKALGLDIIF